MERGFHSLFGLRGLHVIQQIVEFGAEVFESARLYLHQRLEFFALAIPESKLQDIIANLANLFRSPIVERKQARERLSRNLTGEILQRIVER